jgi:putative integral membrane protein (TIGR02587 family)
LAKARQSEAVPASQVLRGLARAFGAALIFAVPMLMTEELWDLGAAMDRRRLALMVVLAIPLLVGVAHRVGFEPSFGWREDLRDAFIALGVGLVAAAAILAIFGVIGDPPRPDQAVGRAAIQAVPAALGALLARSQLARAGEARDGEEDRPQALSGYGGTLFMMLVGALFLSLNMAPTQEMLLISFSMTAWHAIALIALTLAVTHAFVYARGNRDDREARQPLADFLRFSLVGYVLALGVSAAALWLFGRLDGLGPAAALSATVVLGFPSALGAAAARLIL